MMTIREHLKERVLKGFEECKIPEHMHGAVLRYLLDGIHPGSFLTAVLCNNLKEAIMRADYINKQAITRWVEFLYNYVPIDASGSVEKFDSWHGIDSGNGISEEEMPN